MYRKSKPEKYVEPMPKKQLQRIVKAFKKNGGLICMSEETDAYLIKHKAEGSTLNALTILLNSNPGRATVFEELIHATQFKMGKNNGTDVSRIKCEIEAQKKLIKYSNFYQLTAVELEQTKDALKYYQNELKNLMKGGKDYDI